MIYLISNEFDGEVIKCINAGDGDQQNILTIKPPQNACLEILTFDSIVKSEATLDNWHALHISVTDPAWIPDAKSHGNNNKL